MSTLGEMVLELSGYGSTDEAPQQPKPKGAAMAKSKAKGGSSALFGAVQDVARQIREKDPSTPHQEAVKKAWAIRRGDERKPNGVKLPPGFKDGSPKGHAKRDERAQNGSSRGHAKGHLGEVDDGDLNGQLGANPEYRRILDRVRKANPDMPYRKAQKVASEQYQARSTRHQLARRPKNQPLSPAIRYHPTRFSDWLSMEPEPSRPAISPNILGAATISALKIVVMLRQLAITIFGSGKQPDTSMRRRFEVYWSAVLEPLFKQQLANARGIPKRAKELIAEFLRERNFDVIHPDSQSSTVWRNEVPLGEFIEWVKGRYGRHTILAFERWMADQAPSAPDSVDPLTVQDAQELVRTVLPDHYQALVNQGNDGIRISYMYLPLLQRLYNYYTPSEFLGDTSEYATAGLDGFGAQFERPEQVGMGWPKTSRNGAGDEYAGSINYGDSDFDFSDVVDDALATAALPPELRELEEALAGSLGVIGIEELNRPGLDGYGILGVDELNRPKLEGGLGILGVDELNRPKLEGGLGVIGVDELNRPRVAEVEGYGGSLTDSTL